MQNSVCVSPCKINVSQNIDCNSRKSLKFSKRSVLSSFGHENDFGSTAFMNALSAEYRTRMCNSRKKVC